MEHCFAGQYMVLSSSYKRIPITHDLAPMMACKSSQSGLKLEGNTGSVGGVVRCTVNIFSIQLFALPRPGPR